jgi:hypothetical protein
MNTDFLCFRKPITEFVHIRLVFSRGLQRTSLSYNTILRPFTNIRETGSRFIEFESCNVCWFEQSLTSPEQF